MDDLFKKFLYTSVGLASLTAEKLQEAVDDLVGRGKLSENEGKKILDDFFSNTDAKKEEFEAKLREAAESTLDRLSLPTKEEVNNLQTRIADLEKQIELMRSEQKAGDPPKK
jgi:polyhydroxyalkanoate synthesis regulator phasin